MRGSTTRASTEISSVAPACWSPVCRANPEPDRDSVVRMTLWPEEYEGMREEARATATAIAEMFGAGAPAAVPTDRDERVRMQREMMKALEVTSPAGADQEIAGVACRIFRPARPARAVYLHFH